MDGDVERSQHNQQGLMLFSLALAKKKKPFRSTIPAILLNLHNGIYRLDYFAVTSVVATALTAVTPIAVVGAFTFPWSDTALFVARSCTALLLFDTV